MDIHKNARLTAYGRERLAKMILSGQTPEAASEAVGVCPRTGRTWADRFKQEGLAGLQDRSSRPHRLRQPTAPEVIERIAELARGYFEGDEPAETVDDGVDLGRPPAARATDRLRQGPPFPPPAERWALAVVLSMICVSAASVVTRASNRRCQSPRRDHRLNRL